MVSCQRGPTRHAYAWRIGPFWQDTIDMCITHPQWVKLGLKPQLKCTGSSLAHQVIAYHLLNAKPLPEAMLSYDKSDPKESNQKQFEWQYIYFLSRKCVFENAVFLEMILRPQCVTHKFPWPLCYYSWQSNCLVLWWREVAIYFMQI